MSAHQCDGSHEIRSARLLLALHDGNANAAQELADEIDGCARCWQAMAQWLARVLAGVQSQYEGGSTAAALLALNEIARLTAA